MITTKELLKRTGIKNRRTLIRWHQAGLIPPPSIGNYASGRGRTSRWPDWVLGRCRRILKLRKDGYSLSAIRTALGTDWETENDRGGQAAALEGLGLTRMPRQRGARGGSPIKLRRKFAERVWRRVRKMVLDDDALDRSVLNIELNEQLERGSSLDRALKCAREGHSPFLVFCGYEVCLVPDFALGKYMQEYALDKYAYMIVPLLPILHDICSDKNLPDKPSHFPGENVKVKVGKYTLATKFRLLDNGGRVRVDRPVAPKPSSRTGGRRKLIRKKKPKKSTAT